jgi:hypothetical protein
MSSRRTPAFANEETSEEYPSALDSGDFSEAKVALATLARQSLASGTERQGNALGPAANAEETDRIIIRVVVANLTVSLPAGLRV